MVITAADVEVFYAGGKISLRYSSVPVWSVLSPGAVVPMYGVVAATEEAAKAFVRERNGSRAVRETVRPMTRQDRRLCSTYFDARPTQESHP